MVMDERALQPNGRRELTGISEPDLENLFGRVDGITYALIKIYMCMRVCRCVNT